MFSRYFSVFQPADRQKQSCGKNLLEILFIFRNNNHSIPSNDWVAVLATGEHNEPIELATTPFGGGGLF